MYIDGILLIAEYLSIRHIIVRGSDRVLLSVHVCMLTYIHIRMYMFMSRFIVVSIISLRKI